jgi:List-Bact-rpt repeat protein
MCGTLSEALGGTETMARISIERRAWLLACTLLWATACGYDRPDSPVLPPGEGAGPGDGSQARTLTVQLAGSGDGRVDGTGIACPSDCTETYAADTTVSLTATPGTGSTFVGWSGDCAGTGVCMVTVSAARTVTASFSNFAPLHVLPQTTMQTDAPDRGLSGTIDTDALTINGAASTFFVRQNDRTTVLFVHKVAINQPTTIIGSAPLIIVAFDAVTISANINLNAVKNRPGPGAMAGGQGAGGPGGTAEASPGDLVSSGGGGGSYGTLGGVGGTTNNVVAAGAVGVGYGTRASDPLVGGSPGGTGGGGGTTYGLGGAGGGALQISSMVSIAFVTASSSIVVNAGGGGGMGGLCGPIGGGGGGAGGEIILEAPSIQMDASSFLAANGGGGGGGGAWQGSGVICTDPTRSATDGADGLPNYTPATGGTGGSPNGMRGGAGAAGVVGNFHDSVAGAGQNQMGGGGGGGAGRIWLRYRAAAPPTVPTTNISPPASLDPTLP